MDTSWIAPVGYAGLAVLVVAWWVVSFSRPGRRRTLLEWTGACGMYVALLMLFSHLLSRSFASGSTPGKLGFGFFVVFFSCGLLLCVVHTLKALRSPAKSIESPTH